MIHYDEFRDKVALITGAASGIGRATAIAFARNGAKVVIADINTEGGQDTARPVNDAGGVGLALCSGRSQSRDILAALHTYPVDGKYTLVYSGRATHVGLRGYPAFQASQLAGARNQLDPGLVEPMYGLRAR